MQRLPRAVAALLLALISMLTPAIARSQSITTLYSFVGPTEGLGPSGGLTRAADGNFYGVTWRGGVYDAGTVFRLAPDGTVTSLHTFTRLDGMNPNGPMLLATDGNLYGTTSNGGSAGLGTVFSISTGGVFVSLHSFSAANPWPYNSDGIGPSGNLAQGKDGYLYGTTYAGGVNGYGVFYRISTGGAFAAIHQFNYPTDPVIRSSQLMVASDGGLYGTNQQGGANGFGAIFKISTAGDITLIYSFDTTSSDPYFPGAPLVQAGDGNLYGSTIYGGTAGAGALFRITTTGFFTLLRSLGGNDGGWPSSPMILASNGNLYGTTYSDGAGGEGTVFSLGVDGTYAVIHSFTFQPNNGFDARTLAQGLDGALYGVCADGGPYWSYFRNGSGTAFKLTTGGAYSTLHDFGGAPANGYHPMAALTQANDGFFYGTAAYGGPTDQGGVYRLSSTGAFIPLAGLDGITYNGEAPYSGLIQARDGDLYGTQESDGNNVGSIFQVSTAGDLSTFHVFQSNSEGGYPRANLIQTADGTFYGTTEAYGANNSGTVFGLTTGGATSLSYSLPQSIYSVAGPVAPLFLASDGALYGTSPVGSTSYGYLFKITTSGVFTIVHPFDAGSGGSQPQAGLVQASDGCLYGATSTGGGGGGGTIFKLALDGTFSVIYSLTPSTDGSGIMASLVQASDGCLYGTTSAALFKITTTGVFTVLHSFTGGSDGQNPEPGLVLGKDGDLYGITIGGGDFGVGTAYRWHVLPPAVASTLTVAAANAQIGKPTALLATLKVKSTGGAVAGRNVQFAVDGVAVGAPVATGANGQAKLAYTPPAGMALGTHTLKASFAGDLSYLPSTGAGTLKIAKGPSKLSVASITGFVGGSVTLSAKLVNGAVAPIGGMTVNFSIDGVAAGSAPTTATGQVTLPYTIPVSASAGSHVIAASFAGNADYLPTMGSATLTVSKNPVKLSVTSVTGFAGTPVVLSAKLLDASNAAIQGATLSFSVAGISAGSSATNSSGVAFVSYSIPAGTASGAYTITVSYSGDATRQAVTKIGKLTVK